jgi:N-acyl-D-aspartate/D-glutamate deacylase
VDGSGKEEYRANIGIKDGKIACIGNVTDEGRRVILFDSSTIRDTATYESPVSYPEGIPYVFVNGELVVDQYRVTGGLPGKVLRR